MLLRYFDALSFVSFQITSSAGMSRTAAMTGGVAAERDTQRRSTLRLQRLAKERFGRRYISLAAKPEVHGVSVPIGRAVQLYRLAADLHVVCTRALKLRSPPPCEGRSSGIVHRFE